MKHVVGILGGIVFAVITGLVLLRVFNMEANWLYYVITGIVGFVGLSIAEAVYTKRKNR